MNTEKTVQSTIEYVKQLFANDHSGHDFYHTLRVFRLAKTMAAQEGADLFVVQMAALLHDVDDSKLMEAQSQNALTYLQTTDVSPADCEHILYIINNQSFRNSIGTVQQLQSIEAQIVQDADRLDAIGAIGIARTFAYGGNKNREMHNPEQPPMQFENAQAYINSEGTSINHFYEKLLTLQALMNTETGKKLAAQRHQYMLDYLQEFYDEWDGKK